MFHKINRAFLNGRILHGVTSAVINLLILLNALYKILFNGISKLRRGNKD